jgi:hypothetical protein
MLVSAGQDTGMALLDVDLGQVMETKVWKAGLYVNRFTIKKANSGFFYHSIIRYFETVILSSK